MILYYYFEVRNRFLLILLTWIFTVIISYNYKEILLFSFIQSSFTFFKTSTVYFIFTNLTEVFSTYLQLIYFISNQIVVFFILYHILLYVAPGLYNYEYKNLKFIFILISIFWCLSILFLNLIVLPVSCQFFLSFHELSTFNLYFEAKLNEYLHLYILFYFICNIFCQILISVILFLKYINCNLIFIKKFRKVFYFSFFFLATIVTPPDILSQLLLGICLSLFFELLIISFIFKFLLNKYKF